jgi:hypothetical protein
LCNVSSSHDTQLFQYTGSRSSITERFRDFVEQKVLRYHSNHFKNLPTAHDPPDSDCRTNSEESEADEDTGEDAGEDGRDTPSDYRPSKPRRVQALDGVPRTDVRNKEMSTYVAPTAPMIPGPSSMGQTESKLNSANLALNRATPSKYQKQYRTSTDDRMARGPSRSKSASYSGSVSDIVFETNEDSPARRSPEIPSWQQDQSIRVEDRSASKRVCSANNEAERGRKRKKHTDEVLCPRPSLVVKFKLTREKILQEVHRQYPGADINASIPPDPLVLPVGRLQSYTSLPPTQGCHASPLSPQAHRRENMAPPSSWDSHSHPRESNKVAKTLTTRGPATNNSASNTYSAVAESANRDTSGREELVTALQDPEDRASRQRAAAKTSDIPNAVDQAYVEPQAQASKKGTPAATSTPSLNDTNGYSTFLEANITPARVNRPSAYNRPTKVASMSSEAVESMEGLKMFVKMKRESPAETKEMCTITLSDIISGSDFFESLCDEVGSHLQADETIVQADVKRISEPAIPELRTDFIMTKASKRNISWEILLKGLEKIYRKDGFFVELELEACLLVGKVSDETPVV